MDVIQVPLAELHLYDKNPRKITEEARASLIESIRTLGFFKPVLVYRFDETYTVIGGNQRIAALRAMLANPELRASVPDPVPCVEFAGSPEKARIVAIRDNVNDGEWDIPLLAGFLDEMDGDLSAFTGLSADVLEDIEEWKESKRAPPPELGDSSPLPPAPEVPVSEVGRVYQLGPHRILCGDSTDPESVARLFEGDGRAIMIHADPPYGMGKEADGVANDNLYREKLDAFQIAWLKVWLGHSVDNVTAYIWGNAEDLWRLWYRGGLDAMGFELRNELVWDKGSGFGMASEQMHSYPPATERCLFLMRGQQFIGSQNKDDYFEGYEPLRVWLVDQIKAAGWKASHVNRLTGVNMVGHWTGKSQFVIIPRNHYDTLKEAAKGAAFVPEYDELFAKLFPELRTSSQAYSRDLAAAFREGRSYFDNAHDVMTDVWRFSRVAGEERHGHATPKNLDMTIRALRSSSPPGALVAEPFAGSGTTLVACAVSGRVCRTAEIDPRWVDVVRRRWGAWAREHQVDPGPDAL